MRSKHFTTESALDWFTRLKSPAFCLRTGHEELDQLFGSGLPHMWVTEICGRRGMGATTLALCTLAEMLTTPEMRHYVPFFLSYRRSLNTHRLLQLVQCRKEKPLTEHEQMALVRRINTKQLFDSYELLEALEEIRKLRKTECVPFVIVDDVGMILYDTAWDQDGGTRRDQVLGSMRYICTNTGGRVITVNNIVEHSYPVQLALGSHWRNAIKTRIFLETTSEPGFNSAQLQNNDPKTNGKIVHYRIADEGIVSLPPKLISSSSSPTC